MVTQRPAKNASDFGFLFWLHVCIILLILSSPFLFDWHLVLIIGCIYEIQIFALGNCVLTQMQFKKKEASFYEYYLSKLGFRPQRKTLDIMLTYVIPILVLLTALLWQLLLKRKPFF